jgi:hypothetical protein
MKIVIGCVLRTILARKTHPSIDILKQKNFLPKTENGINTPAPLPASHICR